MFTAIKGNNGRTIYVGKVTAKNDTSFRIEGMEWDSNIQTSVVKTVDCTIAPDVQEKAKGIRVGGYAMVMMIPSKDNPDIGTAEEIGLAGDILKISNAKGNEKKIVLGVVRSNKRSESGNVSLIGMTGLKEYETEIGDISTYIGNDGIEHESRWVSFMGCNSLMYNNMVADRLERGVKKNDLIALVFHEIEGEYKGQIQISRFVDKFAVVYRNKAASSENTQEGQKEHAPAAQSAQADQNRQTSQTRTYQNQAAASAPQTNSRASTYQGQASQGQQSPAAQASQGAYDNSFNMIPDDLIDDLPFN